MSSVERVTPGTGETDRIHLQFLVTHSESVNSFHAEFPKFNPLTFGRHFEEITRSDETHPKGQKWKDFENNGTT
jgi:hypothetical protein